MDSTGLCGTPDGIGLPLLIRLRGEFGQKSREVRQFI